MSMSLELNWGQSKQATVISFIGYIYMAEVENHKVRVRGHKLSLQKNLRKLQFKVRDTQVRE